MRPPVIILAILILVLAAVSQVVAAERRPNLVLILADDLGYGDLGCFGQQHIRTPELDRMAAEGLRLRRHYAGSTVCAPSRFTLLTGCHIGRSRTVGQNQELPARTQTMATVLSGAGYQCGAIGKWGLGQDSGHPLDQGFHRFYGFLDQGRAHYYYPDWMDSDRERVPLPDNPQRHHTYIHDTFTDQALRFIEENQTRPFFLYLPYTIPHAEVQVPEDSLVPYLSLLGDPERPPIAKPYGLKGYNEARYPRAARAGMISRMDRDIGRIRSRLAELGLDRDTLIVFTSDNGPATAGGQDVAFFQSAGGLRGLKRSLYEGGIRMPTIACWPGRIPGGGESAAVSISWDWLPTFAQAAGAAVAEPVDGCSLLDHITAGAPLPARAPLSWDYDERGPQGTQAAILDEPWKLIVRQGNPEKVELYHLGEDPQEQRDRSGDEPERVARLRAVIDARRAETVAAP